MDPEQLELKNDNGFCSVQTLASCVYYIVNVFKVT